MCKIESDNSFVVYEYRETHWRSSSERAWSQTKYTPATEALNQDALNHYDSKVQSLTK